MRSYQKLADLLSPTEYGPSATSAGYSINDTFTSGNSADGGVLLSQLTDAFKSLGRGGTTVTKTSAGDRVTLSHMIHGTDLDNVFQAAAAIVILTEWNVYRALNFEKIISQMRGRVLIDLRNIYERDAVEKAGFRYYCVGR